MTSIYDIPYNDINKFLIANKYFAENKDDAYNIALILLKDKKTVGHTMSIIEWIMAHNLLIKQVEIPFYNNNDIDVMSQIEINKLAKLLGMSGNNVNNIKNILTYLHKLDKSPLLPEINFLILQNIRELEKIEITKINFGDLNFDDVINLLKTYSNKSLIRIAIYNNLSKILFYNLLTIDINQFDDLWYFRHLSFDYPISVILELIKINQKELNNDYGIDTINELLEDLEGKLFRSVITNIDLRIYNLVKFLVGLIEIKEIRLAEIVFNMANEHNFISVINHELYSFNEYIIKDLINKNNEVFNVLLNFVGEEEFIKELINCITVTKNNHYIKRILAKLIIIKKYDLFKKSINLLISNDYRGSSGVLNMILPRLQNLIEVDNNIILLKYLKIINIAIDNTLDNEIKLSNINKLIDDIEKSND